MHQASYKNIAAFLACLPFALLSAAGAAFLRSAATDATREPWVFIANLADLPDDGTPVRIAVQVPHRDAWTRHAERPRGYVFLRRLPSGEVFALRAEHHRSFRIPVRYEAAQRTFRSTCWAVQFNLEGREIAGDGALIGDAMQEVAVRVDDGKVFVCEGAQVSN